MGGGGGGGGGESLCFRLLLHLGLLPDLVVLVFPVALGELIVAAAAEEKE